MIKPMVLRPDAEPDYDLPHPPVPDIAQMLIEIEEGKADARAGRTVDGQEALRRFRARADQLRARLNGETCRQS